MVFCCIVALSMGWVLDEIFLQEFVGAIAMLCESDMVGVSEKPVNLYNKSKVASHVFLNFCILI